MGFQPEGASSVDPTKDDGCHLEPTDAGLAARILRLAAATGLLSNVILLTQADVA
jgi:hypothetical protein